MVCNWKSLREAVTEIVRRCYLDRQYDARRHRFANLVVADGNVLLLQQTILDRGVLNNALVVSKHFRWDVHIDAQTSQHVTDRTNLLYGMSHCHELRRIGRGFHCSLPFTVVEHGGSTDKDDDSSNRSASYLIVSVVGIHKQSNRQLIYKWGRKSRIGEFRLGLT